ncbi:unnamed protein product [Brassicogethes aeneus]|uniref:Kynurenine 3-monooxygenase n=1 Tax=Brassicogethes aeneus TaxID=1431903 RepID=A0A9P0BA36_BRAAE|nr:unnamed protein product [Brassicogethes aeneus]
MNKNEVAKVVIVGGGLVGALNACFMAKRGYDVYIFEKREDIRKADEAQGKSINLALSHRGRKALKFIGLEEEILNNAVPMKGRLLHDLNGYKKSVPYDPVFKKCIYSIGRNFLNGKLLEAAEKYRNVKIYFKYKLINIGLSEGRVSFLNVEKNETVEFQADLIIGADGAFSKIRRFMETTPLFEYSQTYIEHGYLELCIPKEQSHLMKSNHLHIWPRGEFMMIALPNKDNSWTVTLFMPFKMFESIKTEADLLNFFSKTFSDSIELIGSKELITDYFKKKPSSLISVKCSPYHYKNKFLLLGDAAHAIVPFYGQGMNAGFEDCTILDNILNENKDNFKLSLQNYSIKRKANTYAISDLAMYNYVEMRDLVTRPSYSLRNLLDSLLFRFFCNTWIPLYNSVSFSEMDYLKCVENRKWQDKVIQVVIAVLGIILGIFLYYYLL